MRRVVHSGQKRWPGTREIRFSVAGFALLALAFAQILYGGLPGLGHVEWIDDIQPESGLAWTARLHDPKLDDDTHHTEASLFEWLPSGSHGFGDWFCRFAGPAFAQAPVALCGGNWRPLGPGHQLHEAIRRAGGGRFSVWHGELYFSLPEGGDPRLAGRSFVLWVPWTIGAGWQGALMAAALLGSVWALTGNLLYRHRRLCLTVVGLLGCGMAISFGGKIAMLGYGGLLLIALQLLPQDRGRSRRLPAALLVLCGFAIAEAALAIALPALGLVPNLQVMEMEKYLVEFDTDRPILLLVGSSLTQYGIDEAALQTALAAAGRPMSVIRLGFGGLSVPERLHYLRRYLAETKHKPAEVLFEISAYYELQPLLQLERNRFSAREIAGMDSGNFRLSLDWVLDPESAPPSRLRLLADLVGHYALHLLHVGFLPNSIRSTELPALSHADPPVKSEHFPDAEIAADLAEGQRAQPPAPALEEGAPIPSRWMRDVLDAEIALLHAAGITRIGFYAPPSRYREEPIYARRFCRAMTAFACISADDPALIAALGHDEDWLDGTHLHGPGRQLYTEWLAARLVAGGLLPP